MVPYKYRASKIINPWEIKEGVHTATVYSGGVNIFDPDIDTIDLRDIANSLERIMRYNGHTERNYSVAEHLCEFALSFDTGENQLHAALHDAAEAYIGDIISPIKGVTYFKNGEMLEPAEVTENRLLDAIYRKLGIDPYSRPSLAEAEQRWISRDQELTRISSNYQPGDYLTLILEILETSA